MRRALLVLLALLLASCAPTPAPPAAPPALGFQPRFDDEIVVCGRRYRTGTRVVLWTDPGGLDAYRVDRRYAPFADREWPATEKAANATTRPARYGLRFADALAADERERVRGGGWTLDLLRARVDQFVVHYSASATAEDCFRHLHDVRGLSAHFLIDADGTVYQTLDLKERAFHATTSNDRSVGVEVANVGARPVGEDHSEQTHYYVEDARGPKLNLPEFARELRPDTPRLVVGTVQGEACRQYDFTPEQYAALAKLTAALADVFPRLPLDAPRGSDGQVVPHVLPPADLARFTGVLGHHHVQANKLDPGPAFQWDRVLREARALRADARRGTP